MKRNYYLDTGKRRYRLKEEKTYTIGRNPKHDIFFSDGTVSRDHAKLSWDTDTFVLEDMNSTNGTWIDGERIDSCRLEAPERIRIGKEDLLFIAKEIGKDMNDETVSPSDSLILENRMNELMRDVTDPMLKERFREINRLFRVKKRNLTDLAYRDTLTGLYNRHSFEQTLDKEWKRRHRYERPLSLIMIDIDHFKSVNDTHGHQKGDSVLKTVAGIIHDNIRSSDYPCRYGGEEMVVILPETENSSAVVTAEKLRRLVEAHVVEIEGFKVTVSLGVSSCGGELEDPKDLIEKADKALYNAKSTGRNKVVSG